MIHKGSGLGRNAAARVVVVVELGPAGGPVPVGRAGESPAAASELVRVLRRRRRRRVVRRVVEERRGIGVRVLGRVRSCGGENVSVPGDLGLRQRLWQRRRSRRRVRRRRLAPVPPAPGAVASDVPHCRCVIEGISEESGSLGSFFFFFFLFFFFFFWFGWSSEAVPVSEAT